jgi:hypothetical protein
MKYVNRTAYSIAVGVIGFCCSAPVTTQAASKPTNSAISSASSSRTVELTRNLGAVEVERTVLLTRFTSDTPVIQGLNRRYTNLMGQLKQLEPARYQALASSASQKALAEKIGDVEVERVIVLTRFTNDTPMVQALDKQNLSLVARLKQIQPARYQSLASSATQSALQSKIAELQALYRQEDRRLIPSTPSQQILRTQIVALNQRLAEVSKN